MANQIVTTQKISDTLLPAFVVTSALLNNSNMDLARAYEQGGIYGIGGDVQIRKYPRFIASSTDLAPIPTGGITVTPQDIQQETETLTIEKLFDVAINLNVIERTLQLREDKAFNQSIVNPILLALKQEVMAYLYKKFVDSLYIFNGDGTTPINSYSQISSTCAIMDEFQMPKDRSLILSAVDSATFAASQVFNNFRKETIDDVWENGYINMINGFRTFSDENVRTHQAGTASTNSGITLSVNAIDGDTTLTLTGLNAAETLVVGDKIVIDTTDPLGVNIFAVSPIGKEIVSNNLYKLGFVVAPAPASNPDYNSTTQTYTAPGATMTVSVVNPVRTITTTDQYAYISAPNDLLPAGLPLTILGNHRTNPAICNKLSMSVAAPPIHKLEAGAITTTSMLDSITINCSMQSQVAQLQNLFVCYLQIGALVHPEYAVGLISQG